MDINTVRSVVTGAAFVAFIGIIWWAYGASRKTYFDQVGRSIFDEEENDKGDKNHG